MSWMWNRPLAGVTRAPWFWRSSEGDPVQRKLRRVICKPTTRYLWVPEDAIAFKPALLSRVYGDGRALMGLTTINNRPAFYVLRVDSSWSVQDHRAPDGAPEFADFSDDICEALEDEFGEARADSEEDDPDILEYGNPWPAFDDRDGYCWWRMDWPKLRSLKFEPHPYSWRGNLLAPNNGNGCHAEEVANS